MPVRLLKITLTLVSLSVFTTSCIYPHQPAGSATGSAMGGIAGAILDTRNPWRGGIIGAALGAIAGATIADISAEGARQAAMANRPVEYRSEDHRARYYAEPFGYEPETRCRRVREKTYVDGRLVKKRVIIICDNERLQKPHYRYDQRYNRYEYDED
jgi:hypothetical protein